MLVPLLILAMVLGACGSSASTESTLPSETAAEQEQTKMSWGEWDYTAQYFAAVFIKFF